MAATMPRRVTATCKMHAAAAQRSGSLHAPRTRTASSVAAALQSTAPPPPPPSRTAPSSPPASTATRAVAMPVSPTEPLLAPSPPAPAPSSYSSVGSRVYAQYAVYKGSAAMQISFIPPTWTPARDGCAVNRTGVMILEVANASGTRVYNWANKITFAMSVTEMGQLLDASTISSKDGMSLFHDPGKGTRTEGQVYKSLSIKTNADGSTMWSVAVRNGNNASGSTPPSKASVPVSPAELQVIRAMAQYAIPHLLGFDKFFHEQTPVMELFAGDAAGGGDSAAY